MDKINKNSILMPIGRVLIWVVIFVLSFFLFGFAIDKYSTLNDLMENFSAALIVCVSYFFILYFLPGDEESIFPVSEKLQFRVKAILFLILTIWIVIDVLSSKLGQWEYTRFSWIDYTDIYPSIRISILVALALVLGNFLNIMRKVFHSKIWYNKKLRLWYLILLVLNLTLVGDFVIKKGPRYNGEFGLYMRESKGEFIAYDFLWINKVKE